MSAFLARMAATSAVRAADARRLVSEGALLERALSAPPAPALRLSPDGFDVIAEVKRRSPAAGDLAAGDEDVVARAHAYESAGAACISVLTEPEAFRGDLGDLAGIASRVRVPVMRKDFLVDPYQVVEARAAGAAGVLLIVRMIDDVRLGEMLDAAARVQLFVLLEAFTEEDADRLHAASARAHDLGLTVLCGVNARDLETLAVNGSRAATLRPRLPAECLAVAESGIASADDAARAAGEDYALALVGTALMSARDPRALVTSMIDAGRTVRRTRRAQLLRDLAEGRLPDGRGRFGPYGGRFVPETLMPALARLTSQARAALADDAFRSRLDADLREWVGRPTPLTRAVRLGERWGAEVWLKREDLAHTGAHKINNATGQALLAQRMGARRIIAETGAGQHGVASAAACARLGLPCTVYMGAVDVARQAPNVDRMHRLGAHVVAVESGDRTLRAAIDEALRDWVSDPDGTYYLLGSAVGPHPYPWLVRELQSVIGREARTQMLARAGRLPDVAVACVGGGSNAIGLFHPFIADAAVTLLGIEAGGRGSALGENAASISYGRLGVLHGSASLLLQTGDGQVVDTHSVSAGLDYPGVGPEHALLRATGRARYETATDDEALDAVDECSSLEGILPALESAHALAGARRWAAAHQGDVVLVGLSGRGDKDLATLMQLRGRRDA